MTFCMQLLAQIDYLIWSIQQIKETPRKHIHHDLILRELYFNLIQLLRYVKKKLTQHQFLIKCIVSKVHKMCQPDISVNNIHAMWFGNCLYVPRIVRSQYRKFAT